MAKKKKDEPKEKPEPKAWPWTSWQSVWVAAVAFMLPQFLLALGIAIIAVSQNREPVDLFENATHWLDFSLSLVLAAASSWMIYLFVKRRKALNKLGFVKTKWEDLGLAIPAYMVYLGGLFLVIAVLSGFLPESALDQEQAVGFDGVGLAPQITAFIVLVIVTPLYEELLFRGFAFRGIAAESGFWPAAIVTSLLFGLAHGQLNVAVDTFILGLVSCALVWQTRSLWPSIILHAIKNTVAFFAVFVF